MPGEVIDRPNPEAMPSQVPDEVMDLAVKLERTTLEEDVNTALREFRRAALYIAAGEEKLPTDRYDKRLTRQST